MADNAPGKHFRKGITLVQLIRTFPDDEAAKQWFVEMRWPNGIECPKCGSDRIQCGRGFPVDGFGEDQSSVAL